MKESAFDRPCPARDRSLRPERSNHDLAAGSRHRGSRSHRTGLGEVRLHVRRGGGWPRTNCLFTVRPAVGGIIAWRGTDHKSPRSALAGPEVLITLEADAHIIRPVNRCISGPWDSARAVNGGIAAALTE